MRASVEVNCQLTCRWSVLVVCCQAASSVLRVSMSVMRRSRHCRVRAESCDFGDVEPGAVAGRVVDLQSLCQCERCGGFECLVERADAVGVEVVHDQHDGLGVGVVVGEQVVYLMSPVDFGSVGLGVDAAPPA